MVSVESHFCLRARRLGRPLALSPQNTAKAGRITGQEHQIMKDVLFFLFLISVFCSCLAAFSSFSEI